MRDLARRVLAAVGPVERPVGRQRAQQRRPLVGVDGAADHVGGRQQHVVLHVEQARGVVAALEVVAEVEEVVAVVLQVRGLGGAAQQRALPLGPVAELGQQRVGARLALDRRPARDRPRSARPTSRWSARCAPSGRCGGRPRCRRPRSTGSRGRRTARSRRRAGAPPRRTWRRSPRRCPPPTPARPIRCDSPRRPRASCPCGSRPRAAGPWFRRAPCSAPASRGSPRFCSACQSASTQVSLTPPPWLELTTSEPSRIATRVRPPGQRCTCGRRGSRAAGRRAAARARSRRRSARSTATASAGR